MGVMVHSSLSCVKRTGFLSFAMISSFRFSRSVFVIEGAAAVASRVISTGFICAMASLVLLTAPS